MIRFKREALPVPPFVSVDPFMASLDADINSAGELVHATRAPDGKMNIYFPHRGVTHYVPCAFTYPNIRWIGTSQVLLFDACSAGMHDNNAWIIDHERRRHT